MTDETMTLSDLRKKAGLSQSQLAKRMNVTVQWVSRVEGMYPDVMFPKLRAYLDGVGVDIRFVMGGFSTLSGNVTEDGSRTYKESRQHDPTRAGKRMAVPSH